MNQYALSVKACGFASSPERGSFFDAVKYSTKPLPSGEVALRSNDGEGRPSR